VEKVAIGGRKRIKVSKLQESPIRHTSLALSLLTRIDNIASVFEEVDDRPKSEWTKDFQRDANPEKEVAIWEVMAAVYTVFQKGRTLALEAKKETFHVLLMRSLNDAETVRREIAIRHLSNSDIGVLLETFAVVAGTDGWWSSGDQPSKTNLEDRPADQPDGRKKDEFSLRDEANALTALAFRNGFLEELHAGASSPLLDDPKNSRITDEEMRRLMIEASEKLGQMLELKRNDPAGYDAMIRDYHDRYCRKWKRD
jgi:hypothetical protein